LRSYFAKSPPKNKKAPALLRGPLAKTELVSCRAQVSCRRLTGPLVGHDFEGNLLAFAEVAQARLFDSADMHKHILAAIVRLDEAISLVRIKPLYCSRSHWGVP